MIVLDRQRRCCCAGTSLQSSSTSKDARVLPWWRPPIRLRTRRLFLRKQNRAVRSPSSQGAMCPMEAAVARLRVNDPRLFVLHALRDTRATQTPGALAPGAVLLVETQHLRDAEAPRVRNFGAVCPTGMGTRILFSCQTPLVGRCHRKTVPVSHSIFSLSFLLLPPKAYTSSDQ